MKIKIWFFVLVILLSFVMFRVVGTHGINSNKKIKTKILDTITDIDGNKYMTIAIGKQVWMMSNLNVTHYRNGDPITNVKDNAKWGSLVTGAYCYYANDSANTKTFGRLYNWYAINDTRNICPKGWHIPSDDEWQKLINYLGGDNVAGSRMKEIGPKYWGDKNKDATNKSKFTALPGGCRHHEGPFHDIYKHGHWWSSTSGGAETAWYRSLFDDDNGVIRKCDYKTHGFSVRCIKNQE